MQSVARRNTGASSVCLQPDARAIPGPVASGQLGGLLLSTPAASQQATTDTAESRGCPEKGGKRTDAAGYALGSVLMHSLRQDAAECLVQAWVWEVDQQQSASTLAGRWARASQPVRHTRDQAARSISTLGPAQDLTPLCMTQQSAVGNGGVQCDRKSADGKLRTTCICQIHARAEGQEVVNTMWDQMSQADWPSDVTASHGSNAHDGSTMCDADYTP